MISLKIIDEVLRFLSRVVVLGVVLLVVVQGMMTNDKARFYLSFDERIDGQKIKVPALADNELTVKHETSQSSLGTVTLELADYSSLDKARVLVNGREKARFTYNQVTITVQPRDLVEIDTTSYNRPVMVKVTRSSDNIAFPHPGILLSSEQSITLLGEIKTR